MIDEKPRIRRGQYFDTFSVSRARARDVATVGWIACAITLAYSTAGLGMGAWRIIETGETPSLVMMVLAVLTMGSWTWYAAVSTPPAKHLFLCNSVGCCLAMLIVALTIFTNYIDKPPSVESRSNTHAGTVVVNDSGAQSQFSN